MHSIIVLFILFDVVHSDSIVSFMFIPVFYIHSDDNSFISYLHSVHIDDYIHSFLIPLFHNHVPATHRWCYPFHCSVLFCWCILIVVYSFLPTIRPPDRYILRLSSYDSPFSGDDHSLTFISIPFTPFYSVLMLLFDTLFIHIPRYDFRWPFYRCSFDFVPMRYIRVWFVLLPPFCYGILPIRCCSILPRCSFGISHTFCSLSCLFYRYCSHSVVLPLFVFIRSFRYCVRIIPIHSPHSPTTSLHLPAFHSDTFDTFRYHSDTIHCSILHLLIFTVHSHFTIPDSTCISFICYSVVDISMHFDTDTFWWYTCSSTFLPFGDTLLFYDGDTVTFYIVDLIWSHSPFRR